MKNARRLPSAPPKTASLYVRLSQAADANNLSLDGMLADLRAKAAAEDLTIVAEHKDNGISGAVRNRPAFLAWLADGREGRADHLLTWHADRLTREGTNVAALILDVVERKDSETGAVVGEPVRLLDVKGLDSAGDETAFRMSFVIAAEVARAERERMRERTRNTQRRLAESGRWRGGRPPFGYRVIPSPNGEGQALTIDADGAALLNSAADRVLAGETLYRIVHDWNAEGIPAPNGGRWGVSSLRKALTSDATVGRMVRKGDVVRDEDGKPRQVWPAAMDLGKWHRARALILRPRTAAAPVRLGTRLLSGIVLCMACGGRMTLRGNGHVGKNGKRRITTYTCGKRGHGGECPGNAISAAPLEDYVVARFLDEVGDLEVVDRVDEEVDDVELAEVTRLISETSRALGATDDEDEEERLGERLRELKAQRKALRAAPTAPTTRLVGRGVTFREEWARLDEAGDLTEQRRLIAANVPTLLIRKGTPGRKGLDTSRVVMLSSPAHVAGAQAPGKLKPGQAVVEVTA